MSDLVGIRAGRGAGVECGDRGGVFGAECEIKNVKFCIRRSLFAERGMAPTPRWLP